MSPHRHRKAALYLRVSTREQTTENQERDLSRFFSKLLKKFPE
jgi:DNA invertase Pin-like site-specific DNA recombinase